MFYGWCILALCLAFFASPERMAFFAPDQQIAEHHILELQIARFLIVLFALTCSAIIFFRKHIPIYGLLMNNFHRWWADIGDQYYALFHGRDLIIYSSMILILSMCMIIASSFNHHESAWFLTINEEDGVYETLQWVSLLFAALIMSLHLYQEQKYRQGMALYMGWIFVFCLFFITGEEISWGQRMLDFATPEALNSINFQHEFNVHNIGNFWMNDIQVMVFIIYFFIVPLSAYRYPRIYFLLDRCGIPTPPLILPAFAMIGLTFNETLPFLWGEPPLVRLSELRETLFYFCVLVTVAQYMHIRRVMHQNYKKP